MGWNDTSSGKRHNTAPYTLSRIGIIRHARTGEECLSAEDIIDAYPDNICNISKVKTDIVDPIRSDLDDIDDDIIVMEADILSAKSDIASIKSDVTQAKTDIESVASKINGVFLKVTGGKIFWSESKEGTYRPFT